MKIFHFLLALPFLFNSCIGDDVVDDFVPPAVRITAPLDTLGVGKTWQFEAKFTNNIGAEEARPVAWSSSNLAVLGIDGTGLATGLSKGSAIVAAEVELGDGTTVKSERPVTVADSTVIPPVVMTLGGEIKSTSSYALKGSFEITESGSGILISIGSDYQASTALPGLYVYLGNNRSSIANAKELQQVAVFNGAHSYQVDGVGLNDYQYLLYWCKPFNVKVGEGEIK
ncbi:MAG: Ig-like domain-containing protein [Lewinellaceae bacterium]|nr:Ig-like domain-containing protein [Saprospiraceae bacterium]MCB9337450.1 Ig-like domain-containing protein [Lewinellaceae bacterium]